MSGPLIAEAETYLIRCCLDLPPSFSVSTSQTKYSFFFFQKPKWWLDSYSSAFSHTVKALHPPLFPLFFSLSPLPHSSIVLPPNTSSGVKELIPSKITSLEMVDQHLFQNEMSLSEPSPQTHRIRIPNSGARNLHFNKVPRWLQCPLKSEKLFCSLTAHPCSRYCQYPDGIIQQWVLLSGSPTSVCLESHGKLMQNAEARSRWIGPL